MNLYKLLGLLLLLAITFGGAPNRDSADKDRTVTFDVAVTDKNGNPVSGLVKENFRVFADGIEQPVIRVSRNARPLAVVTVVELSDAFAYSLPDAVDPAIDLTRSLGIEDWGAVVSFDLDADIVTDFTDDQTKLVSALRRLRVFEPTDVALYDSLYFVLDRMSPVEERKVILLIGTGRDTISKRRTFAQVLRKAAATGTIIYTVGLQGPDLRPWNTYPDFQKEMRRRDAEYTLRSLAEETGGLYFLPLIPSQYSEIGDAVIRDIRNQYAVSFVLSDAEVLPKGRKLEVEVANTDIDRNGKPDKLTVRHKPRY